MSIKPALSFVLHETRIEDPETYDRNPELFNPGAITNYNLFRKIQEETFEIILRKNNIFRTLS